jgi:putative acetyltransferase
VKIRAETEADMQAIEAVTIAAFLNAPHTSHTEQHIVSALRRTGKLFVSLVAEADGRVVGHVAVSPVSISDGTKRWVGLGPLSVVPEYQRRGIGSRLALDALRLSRERGASGCVVLGDPQYYGRFGFRLIPDLILPGVPPEYFQTMSFNPPEPRGVVSYDDAFEVGAATP